MSSTILYVGYDPCYALLRRRRLSGIRRCAKAFDLGVVTLTPEEATPSAVRAAIAQFHAVGCIVECWLAQYDLPPRLFHHFPVVCFNPPERREWQGVATVSCDEAAVAQSAFRELSSGLPPCYAVVGGGPKRANPWARERVAAFRACCRKAAKPCHVFPERSEETAAAREARLSRWVAALPAHCAIFAVNDGIAANVASALASAGRVCPRSVTLVGADAAEVPDDGRPASSISSIRLDFELSGYLAAKAITRMTVAGNVKNAIGNGASTATPVAEDPTFGPLLCIRRQSTRGRGRHEPWVMKAVEMIRAEACCGLTATALAARFPVSRKLFELRFREATGHSALNEILHVRMERVFDYLARPDFPISAIADFCGFRSDRELRNLFLARTGTSMRVWRATRR